MEPTFNTSFIPKKSLQDPVASGGSYVKRRGTYGPGFFLSSLIFILTLIAAVGLFLYVGSVERTIDRKIVEVQNARDAFRPELILALEELDAKLRNAKSVVMNHRAVSAFLEELEKITLKEAQYASLEYTIPGASGASSGARANAASASAAVANPTVTINGQAASTESMALQIEQYRTSKYLHDVVLKSIARKEEVGGDADTAFNVTFSVDPQLVDMQRILEQSDIPVVVSAPESTTTPEASPAATSTPEGTMEAATTTEAAPEASEEAGA